MKLVNGGLEIGAGSEFLYQLQRRSHRVEWRNLQHAGVVEVDEALILVFDQQSFENRARLRAVLREDIALADVVGALAPA